MIILFYLTYLHVYNINSETSYCSHLYTSDLDINGNLYYYNVAEYTDNSAAIAAGLNIGTVYRTGDILKIVH